MSNAEPTREDHAEAPGTVAVLEIEASGLVSTSFPIEAGFVLPDGTSYCVLIQPLPDWPQWDAKARRTHGIEWATLLRHGRAPADVACELNRRLHGLTVYCDAAAPQPAWLATLFAAAGCDHTFRLAPIRSLLSDREAAYWSVLKAQVTAEMRLQRHRASANARVVQATLQRLRAPLPLAAAPGRAAARGAGEPPERRLGSGDR